MSKPIRINLEGGVGNQLFMYCAGYFLSLKRNMRFEPQLSRPAFGDTHHESSINHLQVNPKVLTRGLGVTYFSRLSNRIKAILVHKFPLVRQIFNVINYQSNEIGYDAHLQNCRSRKISGYFQTHKYVEEIRKRDPGFLPPEPSNPSEWYLQTKDFIENKSTIGIHIRGNDYLKSINKNIGVLSSAYFKSGLFKLQQLNKTKNYQVAVFTDDLKHAKNVMETVSTHLRIVYIEAPKNTEPTESLLLMSKADALIISNSTFAWWGGFLGSPKNTVVCPDKWFRSLQDPKELIPDYWIRCESSWMDSEQARESESK